MTMPKAAVYENYSLVFSQDNIRMSRQFLIMKPVSETISVEILADNHFRFCVGRSNGRHDLASFLF